MGAGRAEAGASENVPAGFVYFHPADVRGTFVADRAVARSGQRLVTRRAPLRLVLEGGRVRERHCDDEATCAAFDAYLASHHHAGRVGTLVLPTDYLVRSEIGVYAQDELAPAINVNLGFTHHVAGRRGTRRCRRGSWRASSRFAPASRRSSTKDGTPTRWSKASIPFADPFERLVVSSQPATSECVSTIDRIPAGHDESVPATGCPRLVIAGEPAPPYKITLGGRDTVLRGGEAWERRGELPLPNTSSARRRRSRRRR